MTAEAVSLKPQPRGLWTRLAEGLSWRWKFVYWQRLARLLGIKYDQQWGRVVSDRITEEFVRTLPDQTMDAVEISATSEKWKQFGFQSIVNTDYPPYDLCAGPLAIEQFDQVIAEQVLEHVLWPYRAVKNVYQMLRPNGWFIVATPFLLRVHAYPNDCTRWTEQGLKHLLMEGGFSEQGIRTGSWGNRQCVRANFQRFLSWIPWWHSLRNEPLFPLVVWAFAQKTV